jgi:YVTN family beta-propeller protein
MENSRTLRRSRSFTNVRFRWRAIALLIVALIGDWGCGGGTSQSLDNQPPPPTPTITTISPNSVVGGGAAFMLTINGTNFVASSMVNFGGTAPATTFVNSTQLTAAIPASSIVSTGTLAVSVTNPAPAGGASNPVTFSITTTSADVDPQSIAVDPAGKFAYVLNGNCDGGAGGCVSMYTINPTTGALASLGPPVSTDGFGVYPGSIAVEPSSKFAYATNEGDPWGYEDGANGSIAMYSIDATTGALTSTGTVNGNCPGLCDPSSMVVDPSGKFAYLVTGGAGIPFNVAMYTIEATTGALTSTGTIATGGVPVSVAVDPGGKFVYVATQNITPGLAGSVSMYTINATTGALASIGTIAAETYPASVAVDPAGKFAYVTNSGSNDLSMYTINATTGALTPVGTIAAGADPVSVVVDPSGKFAYVANFTSNDLSMYTIDVTTGALTSTGTIATGQSPTSIAVHPSGKFAYVTNSSSNDVSIYSIDAATGALTLIGTIGT